MTFDELSTFILLAQNKSFSRTAELLFTSQSTISFRVKKIEAQIGVPLFERNTRKIELTPAGQNFLSHAIQIQALYDQALNTSSRNSYQYKLRIGAPDSFWQNLLKTVLVEYFQNNNDISFELVSNHSFTLNEMMAEDKLDIGISFISIQHTNIEYLPLAKNPYLLIAHKDLELPYDKLTIDNVDSFNLIFCRWHYPFNEWFKENYYSGTHFIELDRVWLFIQLLQNKVGIGFMPERIAKPLLDSGEFISLSYESSDTTPQEEMFLMYNRKKKDRLLSLIDLLSNRIKDNI